MRLIKLIEVDKNGRVLGDCSVDPEDIKFMDEEGTSITYVSTNVNDFYVKGTHESILNIVNEARNEA